MQKKLKPTTAARAKKKPSPRDKARKQSAAAIKNNTARNHPAQQESTGLPMPLPATVPAVRNKPLPHGEYSAATYPPTAPEQKPPPWTRLITPPAHMVKVLDTIRRARPAPQDEFSATLKALTALAVDSRTVFVFWSLPPWEFTAEGGPWSVRLYDATGSRDRAYAEHCWGGTVDQASGTTYLQASPGREYFVRIGREGLLGEFISMLESLSIHTPHEAPQPGPTALGEKHFNVTPESTQSS